jgi:hypothetical protein
MIECAGTQSLPAQKVCQRQESISPKSSENGESDSDSRRMVVRRTFIEVVDKEERFNMGRQRSYSDPNLPQLLERSCTYDDSSDATADTSGVWDVSDDRFTDRTSDETEEENLYDASPLPCYAHIRAQSKDEWDKATLYTEDQYNKKEDFYKKGLDVKPKVRPALSSAAPAFNPRGLAMVRAQAQAMFPQQQQGNIRGNHHDVSDHQVEQQQQHQQQQQLQLQPLGCFERGGSDNSGYELPQQQMGSTNVSSPANCNMQGYNMMLMMPCMTVQAGSGGWIPAASACKVASQEEEEQYPKEVPRTTVMVRNIPNNYTRDMFISMLNSEGFQGLYDFAYLPIDFRSRAALGYAFVNLTDTKTVEKFWEVFNSYTRWVIPTRKVGYVTWCGPHQGLEAHVERYRNSPVMHEAIPDEFKPIVLKDGKRASFPLPTRAIRAPRLRDFGRAGPSDM